MNLWKSGHWLTPTDVGYLDQHYDTLVSGESVLASVSKLVPHWDDVQLRNHLSAFLFRTHEEVAKSAAILSGGEKVRLTLAQIAALTPRLLIFDEVTNNLDLETKKHVEEVLQKYPWRNHSGFS